jgi:hypothetical protein
MYRGLPSRDRALLDRFNDLSRRIRVLNQRIKWSGVVEASEPGPVIMLEDVVETLATVTLEPGRWFVVGGTSMVSENPSASYSAVMAIEGLEVDPPSAGGLFGGLGAGRESINSLSMTSTGVLDVETVISMDAIWSVSGDVGIACTATRIYLIAIPA